MPIIKNPEAQHPTYKCLLHRWKKVRDFVGGCDKVKAEGMRYLPMLSGQDSVEYDAYKLRAFFFSVTQRTLNAFVGMVFRKPSTIEAKKSVVDGFLSRCTAKRKPVEKLERAVFRELCAQGRVGLLIDLPEEADANTEPWIAVYSAENIINWRYGADEKGSQRLEFVVLKEEVHEPDPKNPDEVVCVEQWRELELLAARAAPDEPVTWVCQYALWRKTEKKAGTTEQGYERIKQGVITVNGRALSVFPFHLIDVTDEEEGELVPPMEAIAEVNHSHYLTSADLEHGRHFTALPTPYVTGAEKTDKQLKIGSQTAWMISEPQATVGMLEFTGNGLAALEKGLEQKRDMAAALGARMLEDQKKAVEATQTHEIRRSGETSVLATIARQASAALTGVFKTISEHFLPSIGEIKDDLNTDFSAMSLSAQDLTALVAAMQSGAISEETFFYNMEQAEMYPPGHTFDEESKLRQAAFDKKTENDAKRLESMPAMDLNEDDGEDEE